MVTRQDLKELREGVISYPKGQMREEIASARTPKAGVSSNSCSQKSEWKGWLGE